MTIPKMGKHRNFCYKICCMQFHYVILVLSYFSETYLKELPFTHTISVKNDPFWLIFCERMKVYKLLPHNSLQILNYLNSWRLQSNLNVVFERLWIMTCTYLYQLKKKSMNMYQLKQAEFFKYHTKVQGDMPNILFTVTCVLL
jgi:hypothetical protein